MIEAAVELGNLFKVLYTSVAAGVGVSAVFSVAVLGVVRAGEMYRRRHSLAAASYGAVGLIALVVSIALVVYGIVLLAHKS